MRRTTMMAGMLTLALPALALAHVTMRPGESRAAAEERYTVRVPTEGAVATTRVSLDIPDGVTVLDIETIEGATFDGGDARRPDRDDHMDEADRAEGCGGILLPRAQSEISRGSRLEGAPALCGRHGGGLGGARRRTSSRGGDENYVAKEKLIGAGDPT